MGSDGTDSSGGSGSSSGGPPPSFATDVKPIIDATCVAGCHEPGGIWELLDLSADPYGELVDKAAGPPVQMTRVTPGDSANSYLYHKLVGTQESVPGGEGYRAMPLDPNTCTLENFVDPECLEMPLPDADIQLVTAWIDGGAEP